MFLFAMEIIGWRKIILRSVKYFHVPFGLTLYDNLPFCLFRLM